jgi:acetyl esterase/lipase
MKRFYTLSISLLAFVFATAQQRVSLEGADESVRLWDNTTAQHSNHQTRDEKFYKGKKSTMQYTSSCELYIFKADASKNTGVAIAICPGGGYMRLNFSISTARWFASHGITVALVKYRLPNGYKDVPLEDAMGAIRYLRTRTDLGIDPTKVGIMGNSAGGHLSAWTSNAMPDTEKPAFAILHYPAIVRTAPFYTNTLNTTGSLLGMDFAEGEAEAISAHNMVTAATPPTLLMLCDDDATVPPTSPLAYYEALVRHGVKCSIHIFPEGKHSLKKSLKESQTLTLDWLDWLGLIK